MQKKIIIIISILGIRIVSLVTGFFLIQSLPPSSPDTPSDFTATFMSRTRMDLTWTKAKNADTTYIERNSVVRWSRGQGTLIYNDTGDSYQDTGLSPNSYYYYQAWSWNQTNHVFSATFTTTENTTYVNQPPIFTSPNPMNGSTNTYLTRFPGILSGWLGRYCTTDSLTSKLQSL